MKINQLTDEKLLDFIKNSNQEAFNVAYHRYWKQVYAIAYQRLNDDMEAEEVVQDIFVSLWNRRKTLDIKYKLLTYLSVAAKYQIINRQASHYHHVQKKNTAYLSDLTTEHQIADGSTDLWFNAKELTELLQQEINHLPDKCRIVFLKSREEGKSNHQIAAELGISEKTVEAHITRALKQLKNNLHLSVLLIELLLSRK